MDERFEVFVRKNAEYYRQAWEKEYKWNWGAFFFAFLWMGYRKMYSVIFGLLGLSVLINVFLFAVDYELYNSLYNLIPWSFFIFSGIAGNKFYKRKAEKTMIHVEKLELSEHDALTEIDRRGGTSGLGILGALGIILLSGFVEGLILAVIEYWIY